MSISLFEQLLKYYNISESEYYDLNKEYNLSNFYDGHSFKDMDKAVELVSSAIQKKEKILIYGDYDCDGVMGTSILVKMFQYLDYVVSYYLPSRYLDGYGITIDHAKEYVKQGYNLIITVDNGISAFEAIEYLHNNGIKVLVLDHHQMQEKFPLADTVIHPIYSSFGNVAASGAFTAFMFSISMLKRVDKYLATLAAISLISDMMPLLEYNRNLLKAVFKDYIPGEFMAIDLLSEHEHINENVIGLKIAPRINSIGRLIEDTSINEIVKFFTTNDNQFILNYYSYILETNEERKTLSNNTDQIPVFNDDVKSIVICGDYKEGIIGLLANTLVNKYHVPTIVFTKSGGNQLKGSARSPVGFDVVKAFNHLSKYMLTFGGHALAGGCTINEKDFESFKNDFNHFVESTPLEPYEDKNIEINFSEINNENYELINSFSPFGESWPTPILKIKHIKVSTLTYSRDNKHIITSIGYSLRLIGFGFSKEQMLQNDFVDLTGSLRKGYYRGNSFLEFIIKEVYPSNN